MAKKSSKSFTPAEATAFSLQSERFGLQTQRMRALADIAISLHGQVRDGVSMGPANNVLLLGGARLAAAALAVAIADAYPAAIEGARIGVEAPTGQLATEPATLFTPLTPEQLGGYKPKFNWEVSESGDVATLRARGPDGVWIARGPIKPVYAIAKIEAALPAAKESHARGQKGVDVVVRERKGNKCSKPACSCGTPKPGLKSKVNAAQAKRDLRNARRRAIAAGKRAAAAWSTKPAKAKAGKVKA